MLKSRRQFLTYTSLGLLGAAAACRSKTQKTADLPPGAPPAFDTAPPVGPEVSPSTFAEAEKLVQGGVERRRACRGSRQLAQSDGAALRATHRAAQVGTGADARTLVALGRGAARPEGRPGARPVYPEQDRSGTIAFERRGHRLRPADTALAMDRGATSSRSETAHAHLSRATGAFQSQTALRHHAHARAGARTSQEG